MRRCLFLVLLVLPFTSAAEYIPADKLFADPQTFSITLGPEGEYALSHLLIDDEYALILTRLETRKHFALYTVDKNSGVRIRSAQWVGRDSLYIRYKLRGRNEDQGFIFLEFDEEGVADATFERVTADGYMVDARTNERGEVLFALASKRRGRDPKLYQLTPRQIVDEAFSRQTLFDQPLKFADYYVRGEARGALMAGKVKRDQIEIWLLPDPSSEWRLFFTLDGSQSDVTPVGVVSEGTLAVLTDKGTNVVALRTFDLDSESLGDILYQHETYDLVDAQLNESGELFSVSYWDHGQFVTEYFDQSNQTLSRRLRRAMPDKQIQMVSEARGGNMLVRAFGSDDPGAFYRLDLVNDRYEKLAVDHPDLKERTLAKSRSFNVETEDGVSLEAALTLPPENANGKLMVFPHGGPIGVRDVLLYDPEVQYLANRGYAVLKVNFRGSSGFGKAFTEAGVGQMGRDIERDIMAAVNQVREEHSFSGACAIGSSYGGYSAAMLAMQHPDIFECAVAMYGIYDLPLLFNYSNLRSTEQERERVANVVGPYEESLKQTSPAHRVEELRVPLLLVGGMEDEISGFEQTHRFHYLLKRQEKSVETLFYRDVGHGHDTWFWHRHQFAYIDDFLRRSMGVPLPSAESDRKEIAREQLQLARAFEDGEVIPKDLERAWIHYENAFELGSEDSIVGVARFYEKGWHVERDLDRAIALYKRAAEQGDEEGSYRLGILYREVLETPDATESYYWFSRANESGHESAELEMAQSLCSGVGVEQDIDRCHAILSKPVPDDASDQFVSRRQDILEQLVCCDLPEGEADRFRPLIQ